MLAFAQLLEIDALNVSRFYESLSCGGTRAVDLDSFVVGCIRLKGGAKNMDLMDMNHSVNKILKEMHQTTEEMHNLTQDLHTSLSDMQGDVGVCLQELKLLRTAPPQMEVARAIPGTSTHLALAVPPFESALLLGRSLHRM